MEYKTFCKKSLNQCADIIYHSCSHLLWLSVFKVFTKAHPDLLLKYLYAAIYYSISCPSNCFDIQLISLKEYQKFIAKCPCTSLCLRFTRSKLIQRKIFAVQHDDDRAVNTDNQLRKLFINSAYFIYFTLCNRKTLIYMHS